MSAESAKTGSWGGDGSRFLGGGDFLGASGASALLTRLKNFRMPPSGLSSSSSSSPGGAGDNEDSDDKSERDSSSAMVVVVVAVVRLSLCGGVAGWCLGCVEEWKEPKERPVSSWAI